MPMTQSVLGSKSPIWFPHIIFYGRSFREYLAMFDLEARSLAGLSVLDCPGGPSSFAAVASSYAEKVVAVDPLYGLPFNELCDRSNADMTVASEQAKNFPADRYTWKFFSGPEAARRVRVEARKKFFIDLSENPNRYVAAKLPRLPFCDGAFDLVLSGFLLFVYAGDKKFHDAGLREMLRVLKPGGELLIFPDKDINGNERPFYRALMSKLKAEGFSWERRRTRYDIVTGWDTFTAISK